MIFRVKTHIVIIVHFLVIMFFHISPLKSQVPRAVFHKLNVENGLLSNKIFNVVEDTSGFIWIGTSAGLQRFDGIRLKNYLPNVDDEHSIALRDIRIILKDSKDRLWMGGQGFLSRYVPETDSFENYKFKGHLSSIYELPNGTFLMFDNSASIIFHFDPETGRLIGEWGDSKESTYLLPRKRVCKLSLVDSLGRAWVMIDDRELICLSASKNGEVEELFRFNKEGIGPVTNVPKNMGAIFQDSEGTIFIACEGLNRLDEEKKRFEYIPIFPYNTPKDDFDFDIWKICEDNSGYLWIATQHHGIIKYNKENNSIQTMNVVPEMEVARIEMGKYGKMWLYGESNKIASFDHNNSELQVYSHNVFNPNSISEFEGKGMRLRQTSSGTNFFITSGLDYFAEAKNRFYSFHTGNQKYPLLSNNVWGLYEDSKQRLWIGTVNGINLYDRRKDTMLSFDNEAYNFLGKGAIPSICEVAPDEFFISAGGPLLWCRLQGEKLVLKKKFIPDNKKPNESLGNWVPMEMMKDYRGEIWISARTSISRYIMPDSMNPEGSFIVHRRTSGSIRLPKGTLQGLFEDSNKRMWVLTSESLCYMDSARNKFTEVPVVYQGDTIEKIKCIEESPDGTFWAATEGYGLVHLDPSKGVLSVLNTDNGLPTNVLFSVYQDAEGYLWMSSNRGLIRVDTRTKSIETFNKSDGLLQLQYIYGAHHHGKYSGNIYFAGSKGLDFVNPGNILISDFKPKILFSELRLFNQLIKVEKDGILTKPIDQTKKLVLNHEQNVLSIEFGSNDYSSPRKVKYAYKLEGLEEDYRVIEASGAKAEYAGLAPGNYVFKVKSTNSDGVWQENERSLIIKILPPWWATWWFRTVVLLVVVLSAIVYYRYRTAQMKRRQEELEATVKERTEEIATQNEELLQQSEELQVQRDGLHEANLAISLKNQMITDSINYAKRIQKAILPEQSELKGFLGEYFLYYKPKDVVSGDFYWLYPKDKYVYIAVVDCTGHGVPGACMSMVGSSLLNRTMGEMGLTEPGEILTILNKLLVEALKQGQGGNKDGMDLSLCRLERTKNGCKIAFAGAKNSLIHTNKNGENFIKMRGDRHSIGGVILQNDTQGGTEVLVKEKIFNTYYVELPTDSMVYLTTDGLIDQNDPSRMRFGSRRFKQLVEKIAPLDMAKQKIILENEINGFAKNQPQRDDIALIGFRV